MIKVYVYSLFAILICLCAWFWYLQTNERRECFEVYPSIEERVIDIYQDVLQRQPSSKELINASRDINSNTITWDGLRQKLIDSDEYSRMIKLQSNDLAPELNKMLSDSRLIREISAIYRQIVKREIPPKMILPLRDIYISLNYNPFTLAALLQDKKYSNFEEDLQRTEQLDKETTLSTFASSFDQPKLIEKSVEISKSPDAVNIANLTTTNSNPISVATMSTVSSPANASASNITTPNTVTNGGGLAQGSNLTPEEQAAVRHVLDVLGVSPDSTTARSLDATDTNMTTMTNRIQQNANSVFNIHNAARRIDLPHHGDMVLRPEFAWSVPQYPPPVCTSVGQKPLTQPLLMNSKLLLGTPLDDAADTQVGSIMPKFTYQQYVDVPLSTI